MNVARLNTHKRLRQRCALREIIVLKPYTPADGPRASSIPSGLEFCECTSYTAPVGKIAIHEVIFDYLVSLTPSFSWVSAADYRCQPLQRLDSIYVASAPR